MAYVNTSSSVEVKVSGDEGSLTASYNCGRKTDLYLAIDGLTATIEVDAGELDELIAGLRKVRGAMAGDD